MVRDPLLKGVLGFLHTIKNICFAKGVFLKNLAVPSGVDTSQVEWTVRDGILWAVCCNDINPKETPLIRIWLSDILSSGVPFIYHPCYIIFLSSPQRWRP